MTRANVDGARELDDPTAPRVRTSATWGSAAGRCEVLREEAADARHVLLHVASTSSTDAWATAQASGLAMKVGPCRSARNSDRVMAAPTHGHEHAARGGIRRSGPCRRTLDVGVTSAHSDAKRRPVRPKPVAISSTDEEEAVVVGDLAEDAEESGW